MERRNESKLEGEIRKLDRKREGEIESGIGG